MLSIINNRETSSQKTIVGVLHPLTMLKEG
jgi:hypothetical protein